MRLKTWHCLSFLVMSVMVAYSPSLSAGFNSVDDLKMIGLIDQVGPLDLTQLFFPNGTTYYYRPVTILSYILDRDVWGSIASFMHIENILLHLASVFLVYAITLRLLPLWKISGQGLALFAGFFFALHPLTAEPVCWISGRTDLLMTLFILLTVWLILKALDSESLATALLAGLALCIAGLAKEIAVFVLPGLLWLIAVYPGSGGCFQRVRQRWSTLLMPIVGVAGYFALRNLATAHDSGMSSALTGVVGGDYDLLNKVRIAFKVYGFYFKKLFVPWPLNFGIIDISDWYVLSGILLALLLLYLAWRFDVAGAFGLMAFCSLSPALLVVFGKMTWTPLAERYLYSSVALFAPLAAYLVHRLLMYAAVPVRRRLYLPMALLLLFLGTTLHRSWVWQDNLRLYQDTVAKSPGMVSAKNELASALQRKGRLAEAEEILAGMQTENDDSGFISDDINLANINLSSGDLEKAREVLLPHLDSKHKQHHELLQTLLRINDQRIGRAETLDLRLAIQQESMAWLEEQQSMQPNPFTLYRIARMQLSMGNTVASLATFRSVLATAPADAYYLGAVETSITMLESL